MGAERTAVIGVGQTRHVSARHDVSIAGLVREAAQEALEDAGPGLGRHRRRRDRQGARHVRGRRDARAVPGRRAGRDRQADDPGPHRGQRRRLDRDRRGEARDGRRPRAGAHGRVREAVREQRDVGALGRDAVPGAARRRRRAATSRRSSGVHPPIRCAGLHRAPGVGEGPPQRVAQPEGAAAPARHRPQDRPGVDAALGAAPAPRRLPELRRRDGDGHRQRAGRGRGARGRSPGSTAPRCAASRRCSPAGTR